MFKLKEKIKKKTLDTLFISQQTKIYMNKVKNHKVNDLRNGKLTQF